MKSTILVLGSFLAAAAVAQPHGAAGLKHQHQHQAVHHKRDGPLVVWETELSYVTETVDITTTIWVSSGFVPPTSAQASPTSSSTSTVSVAATPVPAQFFEPAPSSHSEAPVPTTTSTSSVYVPPTQTSTYVAPTISSAAPVYVAPVESASPTPVSVSETTATAAAAVVVPAAVASSSAAAAPAPASSAASSSTAPTSDCSLGSPCSGDMTHYDAGMGACGTTNNGTTQKVVALSHLLMGTQSNGNPYCGTTITVTCVATGKSTTAEVVDKCMGCKMWDVDLSDAVFSDIEDMGVGRTTATWYFN